jgi:hypothetical protein
MKVLKSGKWELPFNIERVCANLNCGALLSLEENDILAFDDCHDYGWKCIVCDFTNSIEGEDIPGRITSKLDKKRRWNTAYDR